MKWFVILMCMYPPDVCQSIGPEKADKPFDTLQECRERGVMGAAVATKLMINPATGEPGALFGFACWQFPEENKT